MKVFLGGTCAGWKWRNKLQPLLKCNYYNPIVANWSEADRQREVHERETSDFVLYGITNGIKGVYSIAEVVDDSNKRPEKTVFVYLSEIKSEKEIRRFTKEMLHSLEAVAELVKSNGGKCFTSMDELIDYIREFINK